MRGRGCGIRGSSVVAEKEGEGCRRNVRFNRKGGEEGGVHGEGRQRVGEG